MERFLVIKVQHGDVLRRFSVRIAQNDQLDLDLSGLRGKIISLFNIPPGTEFTLTYVDEDGDLVALVDDEDLHDVVKQHLKYLRINVQLNDAKGRKYAGSTVNSTPLGSPGARHPPQKINFGVEEVVKSIPEPLREAVSKLSSEIAAKAATSSSPMVAEIVEHFLKMGQLYMNSTTQSQQNPQGGVGCPPHPSMANDLNASNEGSSMGVAPKNGDGLSSRAGKEPLDSSMVNCLNASKEGSSTGEASKKGNSWNSRADKEVHPSVVTDNQEIVRDAFKLFSAQNKEAKSGKHRKDKSAALSASSSQHPSNPVQLLSTDHSCPTNRSRGHGGVVLHRGVQCDGCGVDPITGSRYKSKVRENFDLCSLCFAAMGNEADYIRLDRPVSFWHPRPHIPHHDVPYFWNYKPAGTNPVRDYGMKIRPKLDGRFVSDVNIADGTRMAPSTTFTKIWRMRNNGNIVWPQGIQLVWVGGDRFSDVVSVEVEVPADGLPVNGELDIAVDFTAPESPGRYISYWRLASSTGQKFGQRVWVLIQVDASLKDDDSLWGSFRGLNLNLPPEACVPTVPETIDVNIQSLRETGTSVSKAPEIIDVNVQLLTKPETRVPKGHEIVDANVQSPTSGDLSSPSVPSRGTQSWESTVEGQNGGDQNSLSEKNLLNALDNLGRVPMKSDNIQYPLIDISEQNPVAPAPAVHAPLVIDAPMTSKNLNDSNNVEKLLLKELEDMGFTQLDLNKEILRMNEYDLQRSVDDLCGVAEWDPILEELEEMGFYDRETNKKLLMKNNGSIKRVVMDLIKGEKA